MSTPANRSIQAVLFGTFTLQANGDYVFVPAVNWSGTAPQVTYTTNTTAGSTLDLTVTAVA